MTGKYQRVTNYTYCLQPCVITIFVYQCNHATEDEEKVSNKNCKKKYKICTKIEMLILYKSYKSFVNVKKRFESLLDNQKVLGKNQK